jgi:hypothetical protein
MYKVKFPVTVKYKRTKYPAHTVFEVDDADIQNLVKDGAIIIEKPAPVVEPPVEPPVNTEESPDKTENNAEVTVTPDMTVAELTAFAESKGIDITGKTKKAEIFNTIVEALGK